MVVRATGRLGLGLVVLLGVAACNVTSGYSPPVYPVHVKPGVSASLYEADLTVCRQEGSAASAKVDMITAPTTGGGLAGGIAGGVAAGLVDATRRGNAFREGLSACFARKGYVRKDLTEDPTLQFPGMGNAQLQRLNAHLAAGNPASTFNP